MIVLPENKGGGRQEVRYQGISLSKKGNLFLSHHLKYSMWIGRLNIITTVCVYACVSHSVVSNSLWPNKLQLARLPCPWNSPGKNTGVGSHSFLQGIFLTQGLNPGLLHAGGFLTVSPVSFEPHISMMKTVLHNLLFIFKIRRKLTCFLLARTLKLARHPVFLLKSCMTPSKFPNLFELQFLHL